MRSKNGFTLIEVIGAMAAFTIAFLAGVAAFTKLYQTSVINYQRTLAGIGAIMWAYNSTTTPANNPTYLPDIAAAKPPSTLTDDPTIPIPTYPWTYQSIPAPQTPVPFAATQAYCDGLLVSPSSIKAQYGFYNFRGSYSACRISSNNPDTIGLVVFKMKNGGPKLFLASEHVSGNSTIDGTVGNSDVAYGATVPVPVTQGVAFWYGYPVPNPAVFGAGATYKDASVFLGRYHRRNNNTVP